MAHVRRTRLRLDPEICRFPRSPCRRDRWSCHQGDRGAAQAKRMTEFYSVGRYLQLGRFGTLPDSKPPNAVVWPRENSSNKLGLSKNALEPRLQSSEQYNKSASRCQDNIRPSPRGFQLKRALSAIYPPKRS